MSICVKILISKALFSQKIRFKFSILVYCFLAISFVENWLFDWCPSNTMIYNIFTTEFTLLMCMFSIVCNIAGREQGRVEVCGCLFHGHCTLQHCDNTSEDPVASNTYFFISWIIQYHRQIVIIEQKHFYLFIFFPKWLIILKELPYHKGKLLLCLPQKQPETQPTF